MAEVVLAAEVGRPTGSRAVRRLRREGKIPAVIYGHGTDPLPVAIVARELPRRAQQRGRGQPAPLARHRFGHVPGAGPRDAAPPRGPDGDPRGLRHRPPRRGDQRRRADRPRGRGDRGPARRRSGRAADVHPAHQRACRPPSPPPSRPTSARSPSAGRSGCRSSRCRPASRPTSIPRRRSPWGSRRGSSSRRRPAKARARRGPRPPPVPSRVRTRRPRRAAKRARPCAAPLPGRSTGGHRRTCSSSGSETPERNSPGACTTPGPTRSSCWRSGTARPCGPRRASTPAPPW